MVVSWPETIRPVSLPVACFHACRTLAVPSDFLVGWLVGWVGGGGCCCFLFWPFDFSWCELRQKMAVVPPILVLNYTIPSNPQQVKQEVEARSAMLHREWCREKREIIHILINSAHSHVPRIVHTILRWKISPQKIVSIFVVDFPQVTLSWLRGQGFHEMLVAGLQWTHNSMLIGGVAGIFVSSSQGFLKHQQTSVFDLCDLSGENIQCRKRLTHVDANRDAQMSNLDGRFPD